MSNAKIKSVEMAKKKGHVIESMHDSWAILRENAPDNIHLQVWNCFIDVSEFICYLFIYIILYFMINIFALL